jgi:hypothetical protein
MRNGQNAGTKGEIPMTDASTRTIARIKLDEMRRQRDRLNDHYIDLEGRATAVATLLDRLRVLYDGLRQVQFAQKPFHPDVANLEAVFFEAEVGTPSAELVTAWVRQLERELARGRLRAEFAYVFGRLLDEWSQAASASEGPAVPGEEQWPIYWQPDPPLDLGLLARLFQQHRKVFSSVVAGVKEFAETKAQAPATGEEVYALLSVVAADTFAPPERRRLAALARGSPTHLSEYAGVLTVLLNNLPDWHWPTEGVPLRPLWKFGKWRPHLDEDLVNGLLLQLIGLRWGMQLKELLNPPLVNQDGLFPYQMDTTWAGRVIGRRLWMARALFLERVPDKLAKMAGEGYGYQGGRRGPVDVPTPLERLLVLVNAELRFHRAALPDLPVHVVHADLRDYYPSIPHPVLLALVEHLGFPAVWLDFFRKYLPVPLRTAEGVQPVRRGLLLEHLLAAVLADVLLLLMDAHILQVSGLRTLRAVDDIYLVSESEERIGRAWQALREFCTACGLEVNEPKSGAVCVGGKLAPGLPANLPRWGLLRLHADGLWHLDEEALVKQEDSLREQIVTAASVLALVARYNDHVGYLHKNLGLPVWLDDGHLTRAGHWLARVHQRLLNEEKGIVDEVRRRLNERLVDPRLQERGGLPEALFYWPITAGGLGLRHPLIAVRGLQLHRRTLAEPSVPKDRANTWESQNAWQVFYQALFTTVQFSKPVSTPGLESLLKDFIQRGSEVGGRKQKDLGAYWQWVVYTYGPALLEALGTFRFLLTELVPLQLILEHRGTVVSLSEDGTPGKDGQSSSTAREEIPF